VGQLSSIDPLYYRARNLVAMANAIAIDCEQSEFLDNFEFTELDDGDVKGHQEFHADWIYYVTIAIVFISSTYLMNQQVGSDRERRLTAIVAREFERWNATAIETSKECGQFFDRTYSGYSTLMRALGQERDALPYTVGAWVVQSMLGHLPRTAEEVRFAFTIGALATQGFHDWWSE